MGRVPASLVRASRDLAVVGLVAFGAATLVLRIVHQRGASRLAGTEAYVSVGWPEAMAPAKDWAVSVLAWALVVWCASRTRAGARTAWLPGVLGGALVTVGSAVALGCGTAADGMCDVGATLWPGPAYPIHWDDGSLDRGSPAWAFPLLAAGLLALAAVLGTRAGRLPGDAATRHVAPVRGAGVALAALVLGIPALAGGLGAVLAWHAAEGSSWLASPNTWQAMPPLSSTLVPLALVLAAAALLSGTGPLGVVATVLVALPVVAEPFRLWLSHGWSAIVLGETTGLVPAVGLAVVVAAAALWRPAAVWAGTLLGPARVPEAAEPVGEVAE